MAKIDYKFTPKGVVEQYAALHKPDYKTGTPFESSEGEWRVNLTLQAGDAAVLIEDIKKAHEANYKKLREEYEKNPPKVVKGKKALVPYEGDLPYIENEDGTVTFKFKSKASFKDKDTKELKSIPLNIVDSKRKKIQNPPAIGAGSIGKVRFYINPYPWNPTVGASVSLRLGGFMLIDLVKVGQNTEEQWEGEEEEGGYVASEDDLREDIGHGDQGLEGESEEPDDEDDF